MANFDLKFSGEEVATIIREHVRKEYNIPSKADLKAEWVGETPIGMHVSYKDLELPKGPVKMFE